MSGKRWARRSEVRCGGERAGLDGAPGGNGEAALLCCEGKKWNGGAGRLTACAAASSGEHQQRVQASHGAWPGRSVGRRRAAPRGRRILNWQSTVESEFFISVTN